MLAAKINLFSTHLETYKKYSAALIQAAPTLFNKAACIEKVITWCEDAAKQGAKLVVFPESFIPLYPRGLSFGAVVGRRTDEGRELWQWYFDESVDLSKDELAPVQKMAQQLGLHIYLGFTEKEPLSGGTLYCSSALINDTGEILGVHRKLKPTGTERVIWGEGDGKDLKVFDTKLGKLGGLICWENYVPLARMALYQQGVQVYIAPTADARPTWQGTLQHIATEGRCFVLGCNQFVKKEMYPKQLQGELNSFAEIMCPGGTAAYNPLGKILASPVYNEEALVIAEIDLDICTQGKMDFDVAGHYHRPDVFDFSYPNQKGK